MTRVLAAALAAAAAFLGAELAAGGLGYGGKPAPRPCEHRERLPGSGIDPLVQRLALGALDAAACAAGKSREELLLELAKKGSDLPIFG